MSQDWSPTAAAPPAVKGKGMIWTGVILLLVGVVLAVVGIVGLVASAANFITGFGEPVQTPAKVTRTLDGGTTYAVYELSALGSGTGTQEDPLLANVSPSDVSVVGPDGASVTVRDPGAMTQTYSSGGKKYFVVATFDPPTSGAYEISIGTEGAEVLVAPSFSAFGKSLGWVAGIGFGGLLALIGLVLLIAGAVRRSSSKKRVAAAAGGYRVESYPGQYATPPAPAAYGAPAGAAVPVAPVVSPPVTAEPEIAVAPEAGVAESAAPVQPAPPAAPAPPAPPVPPAPAAALPPAGWYPDPGRAGGQRYWDGGRWTEHTA